MSGDSHSQDLVTSSLPDSTVEPAHGHLECSRRTQSPELISSLDVDVDGIDGEPFAFMLLPIEIRNTIYRDLLIDLVPVVIYSAYSSLYQDRRRANVTPAYRRAWHILERTMVPKVSSPKILYQLALTSRGVYREAMPIFFAHTTFEIEDLRCVPKFFGSLSPNSRRAITSINLWYVGKAPAAAFKMLATCVGLRNLRINMHDWETNAMMRYPEGNLMKLPGLRECLEMRGFAHVDVAVERGGDLPDFMEKYWANLSKLCEALQVLKQPHEPSRIARLNKIDYPNRLHRSIFGRANVTTRMENKVMGTTPE